jgi:hypothetical protein
MRGEHAQAVPAAAAKVLDNAASGAAASAAASSAEGGTLSEMKRQVVTDSTGRSREVLHKAAQTMVLQDPSPAPRVVVKKEMVRVPVKPLECMGNARVINNRNVLVHTEGTDAKCTNIHNSQGECEASRRVRAPSRAHAFAHPRGASGASNGEQIDVEKEIRDALSEMNKD